jgi:segregation and condensation protein A
MEIPVVDRPTYECSLYELLQAYARQKVHREPESLRVDPHDLYSVEDALGRLKRLLGVAPTWSTLAAFLPPGMQGGLQRRSAFAATFAASLEMVRDGKVDLRQEQTFGPIFLRPRAPEADDEVSAEGDAAGDGQGDGQA